MIPVRILFMMLLIPVCAFGPGFFVVRKLAWDPMEKVAASIGLSVTMLFFVSAGIYLLKLPWAVTYGVSAACLGLMLASHRELRRLFGVSRVRTLVLCFLCLMGWQLLLLGLVRHFTGGCWCCDWYEHWERTLHFVNRGPPDHLFFAFYHLPARPPLMNVVSAFFVAQVGEHFYAFQVLCAFLNMIVFLPCVLLARLFVKRGDRQILLIAIFFALCPTFYENAAFTWTKALTNFFIVLAVWFYLTAWRRGSNARMVLAFASLAVGIITHYSAAPYAVFLALHYLALVWRKRPHRWLELGAIGGTSAGLLATWFSYSIYTYGLALTLSSNTTAMGIKAMSLKDNVFKIVGNIGDTLVPHLLRSPPVPIKFNDDRLRWWVDNLFTVYQVDLFVSMGCIGGVFVLGLFAWRLWPRAGSRKREQLFWLLFVVCCICLGVATQGERDHYGVAHITLQSLTLLGITFLAANLTHLPRWLRWVPIFGLAIDFALGILLLVRMENSLDKWAIGGNLDLKHANNWNLRFLGDLVPPAAVPLQVLIVALVVVMLWLALRRSGIVPPLFRRRAEAQPEPAPH